MSKTEQDAIVTLTQEQQNRKLVIPFYTQVGATAQVTNVASKISHHYRITKIEIHFRDDTANNLQVRVYASDSADAPTTNPPTGTNVIGKFSSTPYVVGQGQTIIIDCNYIPTFYETWLKVHLNNTNAYALTSMVLVTIESITAKEAQELITESQFDIRIKEPDEYRQEIISKGVAQLDAFKEIITGSYDEWELAEKAYKEYYSVQVNEKLEKYQDLTNITKYIWSDIPLQERYKNTKAWVTSALEVTKDMESESGLVETITGIIGGSVKGYAQYLETMFGIKNQTAKLLGIAFEKAAILPVEYYWNKMYQPVLPSVQDMVNMVVKEVLPLKDFQEEMTYQGYSHFWSQKIWDAHYQQPDFSTVREAYWRKGIPASEIEHYMKLVDLDPRYNDTVWKTLLKQIPNYTDLINMRVKEVITQEQFEEALNFHGYFGEWSTRLWDAHFQPANFNDFLTAFRRNMSVNIPKAEGTPEAYTFGENTTSDIEKIKELSILADYDSRYWDFFKTRIYNDPTPRQARWGYEAGVLNEQQVYDICLKNGFAPSDASWFADFSMSFQERPFITKYLSALQTAYIQNVIDAEELTTRIEAIPRRKEIAQWIIRIADVKKEIAEAQTVSEKELTVSEAKLLLRKGEWSPEDMVNYYVNRGYSSSDATKLTSAIIEAESESEQEKVLTVGELKQMFVMSVITEDDFRIRMQLRGFTVEDVDNLITLYAKMREEKESGGQKRALSVSEMLNAFKFWQITREELTTNLMARGLTLDETNLLIDSKIKQWKMSANGWSETEQVQEG